MGESKSSLANRVRGGRGMLAGWLWPRGLGWSVARTLVTVVAVGAWLGLSHLLTRRWPWEQFGAAPSQSDIFKLALAVVAAGGGAIALVVNYRRQRHLELDGAGRRDELRLFTERFGAAAAQLGGAEAPVRLAGVYAMAALADEWTAQRQQCIDVLCGYLRLPYVGDPPPGHPELVVELHQYSAGALQRTKTTRYRPGEVQVRRAIVATIAQHLQMDTMSPKSWSDLNFNFTGADFFDTFFDGATFSGERTLFIGATFSGEVTRFDGATFSGMRTRFDGATFSGMRTRFDGATFAAEVTRFDRAVFSGDGTRFDGVTFSGASTRFDGATFSGERTSFDRAVFSGEGPQFDGVTFSGVSTRFDRAAFCGAITSFREAVFSGEHVSFDGAVFSGDQISFDKAAFVRAVDSADRAEDVMRRAQFVDLARVTWGPIPPPDATATPGEAST